MGGTGSFLRRSAAIVTTAAVFACVAAASASAAPFAYTANLDAGTVSVIDTQTNTEVGEIEVGEGPSSIALTPDGSRAYVANSGGTVSVIDTASRETIGEPIEVGEDPSVIAVSPNGKTAYVSDDGSNEVSVIDTQTNTKIGSVTGIAHPHGLAVSPDGKTLYVTSPENAAVFVIDTQTLNVVGEPIPVGEGPMTVLFAPDGKTAYVADEASEKVSAINTATREVLSIKVGSDPWGLGITPDGRKLFVSNLGEDSVSVIDTLADTVTGEIAVGSEPYEFGMIPDGKVAYLGELGSEDVVAIDTQTDELIGKPIEIAGGPWQVVVAPDQSPTAVFTPPSAVATFPTTFDGSASTDPDGGLIASYDWSFGDGATASGPSVSHTYGVPGAYAAKLSVVDNEGCGEAEVFTGRTALCSGGASSVTHPVTVTAPVKVCAAKFRVGRLVHNRRNGTARLQVKVASTGSILLFGSKVHAVTRKVKKAGSMFLTLHARVELNKRLKKIHRTNVRIRVTFTPTVGCGVPKTVHRSVALLRAPRKHHH
jgi:YVTN family beta-propeller protein